MLGTMTTLLAISITGLSDAPSLTPDEFRSWFDASMNKKLSISPSISAEAARYRYVFVGGLRGEGMHEEFGSSSRDLRACGVPKRSIHVLFPSSHKTVEQNADTFRSELHKIAEAGPEPLVVIAHSRGACDILVFALKDPSFVQERVRAMFLVQGPFGGSGLADYVMGEGPPVDSQMTRVYRTIARMIGGFERYLMKKGRHGGIADLTRESSRRFWGTAVACHPEAVSMISPKVFYIEAETEPSRLKLLMRSTATYLHLHYGPNDGVVARGDQTVDGVGTSLGVYDAGHSDLTRRSPGSRQGKKTRKAIIDSIVMAVGQSAASD